MTKEELQALRKQLGISQVEMANMIGVSRSTIQRVEYGSSPNQKVKSFYENLADNVKYAGQFLELQKETASRVSELEKAGLYSGNQKTDAPAADWLAKRDGVPEKKDIGTLTAEEIKSDIRTMKGFLEKQTSTVEGYNRWKANLTASTMAFSERDTEDENILFWDLYNELKKDKTIAYDSNQFKDDINYVIDMYDTGYTTKEQLLKKIYKKREREG